MTAPSYPRWLHLCLLLVWLLIGIGLRLTNLTAKSPWTDEFSTLVFSLGNSFLPVPLDQPITIDVLLQPLQLQPATTIKDVLAHLFSESNHPPLYFALTHLWLKLFPTQADMVSLWGARSLAAIFGAVSIPAIYGLSWLAFRSRLVSHLAAAMMAISPYGIFLAQEARHYTLAILWVIASFACLVVTARHIQKHTQLPIWLVFSWVGINALGIATHYFFALTLCTEAVVLIFLAWQQWKQGNKGTRIKGQGAIEEVPKIPNPQSPIPNAPPWRRIYAVAVGTFIASIIWLPVFLHNTHGNKLTDWIQGDRIGLAWISPIFQAIAAWITMISLLPVESPQLLVVIISGLVMIIFFIWAIPILVHGLKILFVQSQTRLITQVFVSIILAAIALFFCFTYFFGIDLTRGARYNFVYFPAVIVLVGASLAICWNTPLKKKGGVREWGKGTWRVNGKMVVAIIWVMGLASAITVVCNLGYQKYYRPDLFIQLIQKTSQVPALIATTQKTHVQIGEMMGVAREFKLQNSLSSTSSILPLFFLAHQDQDPNTSTTALQSTLKLLPRPFDLWLVNFYAPEPEAIKNCIAETRSLPAVNGYEYKIYHCNS
ncbi:MAG: phospholipid carrier-dependent glycosyltransferase [Fischerella sp.]|uniref:glycosyltransferase family 39 protein n=1 Tax=Fischerella sp. TaxID=1191 RepID=UPI0017C83DA8|nr:phospholipid carrier-dependent glycosyltransferase [Fischerella sp.]NWF61561.1 phospholipid carrier-dependent glycosyltransferase [Fischerella sp.]